MLPGFIPPPFKKVLCRWKAGVTLWDNDCSASVGGRPKGKPVVLELANEGNEIEIKTYKTAVLPVIFYGRTSVSRVMARTEIEGVFLFVRVFAIFNDVVTGSDRSAQC